MSPMEVAALDSAKILRQVEFYFSDSNLYGDKFLLKSIAESDDGLVSLPLVCSFSRMRSYLGLKEHGPDNVPPEMTAAVAEILRNSKVLLLSDDGLKVGRATNISSIEEVQAEVTARSIAASPLPWNVTLDDVESFFAQHAKVNSVRLPRHAATKAFSGYAVIEFASEEAAQKVLDMKLTFHGADLELEQKKIFDEKKETAGDDRAGNNEKTGHDRKHQNGKSTGRADAEEGDEGEYPKGVIVSLTFTKYSKPGDTNVAHTDEEAAVADEKAPDSVGPVPTDLSKEFPTISTPAGDTDLMLPGEDVNETLDKKVDAAMEVDEVEPVTREDIKDAFNKFGKVKYVDYCKGETAGFVRFEFQSDAQKARAAAVVAAEGGLVIKSFVVTLNPVEGEAEKEYWKKLRTGQGRRREFGGRGFRGGRFGRGRSSGGRGRRSSDWDDKAANGSRTNHRREGKQSLGKHKRLSEDDADDSDNKDNKVSRTEELKV